MRSTRALLVALAATTPFLAQASQGDPAVGQVIYESKCAECHGDKRQGSAHGTELTGHVFVNKWGNQPVSAYYRLIAETMPAGRLFHYRT